MDNDLIMKKLKTISSKCIEDDKQLLDIYEINDRTFTIGVSINKLNISDSYEVYAFVHNNNDVASSLLLKNFATNEEAYDYFGNLKDKINNDKLNFLLDNTR